MKDLLNRNFDIENLTNIINDMTRNGGSCSFAIDGAWGCGKSWVLDKLEKRLQGIGDYEEIDLDKVKGNYFVFHYNAWENDYYDEPLIAILSTLAEKLDELYKCVNFAKAVGKEVIVGIKDFFNTWIKNLTGIDVSKTAANIKSRSGVRCDFDGKLLIGKAISDVRRRLADLADSQMANTADGDEKFPLIFIVDELDRCLPEYAIKVLERLHHVFNGIPRCVTILSLDKNQLNHTVQNIFGDGVNKEAYLAKFIDFTYNLDDGAIDEQLFWQEFNDYKECFCELYMNAAPDYEKLWTENLFRGIPMRERFQIVKKAKFIHNVLTDKKFQISVMYYEIYLTVLNRIGKYDGKEIIEYEKEIEYINNDVSYQSKIKNSCLNFISQKYKNLRRKYDRSRNKYNMAMTCEYYFDYMFYIYNFDKHELGVVHFNSETDKSITAEKEYLNRFKSQLNIIN